MDKLNIKLRSQKGASLSIALLLFLVCMVVGAIILTAGTTASGRLSKLTEMDQRYYSVTSAAEILSQELSRETVTIERIKTTTTTVTTDYAVDYDEESGETTVTPGSPSTNTDVEYRTTIKRGTEIKRDIPAQDTSISASGLSFLTARAVKLLFGTNNCNTEASWNYTDYFSEARDVFSLELSASDDRDLSYLKINGSYEMKSDGRLIIDLTDALPGTSGHYTMRITMSLDPEKTETRPPSEYPPIPSTDTEEISGGYREIKTTVNTVVKSSSFGWKVMGVEKVASAPATP